MARRRPVDTTGLPIAVRACDDVPVFGDTNPRFYEFDDAVVRLVKWHPSRFAPKGAYCELVASRLGALLGAPVLRAEPVYVDHTVIHETHAKFGAGRGVHLGFRRLDGEPWRPSVHADRLVNAAALPPAAVLLAWLDVFGHDTPFRRGGAEVWPNGFAERIEPTSAGAPGRWAFWLVDLEQLFSSASWTASPDTRCKARRGIMPTFARAPERYVTQRVHGAYALPAYFRRALVWERRPARTRLLDSHLRQRDLAVLRRRHPCMVERVAMDARQRGRSRDVGA